MEGLAIMAASTGLISEPSPGKRILKLPSCEAGMLPALLPQTCVVAVPSFSRP